MRQYMFDFEHIVKELSAPVLTGESPPAHDEMIYLIVNQTYELWLKEILNEATYLQILLTNDDSKAAARSAHRVIKIFNVLVSQMDLVESMSLQDLVSYGDNMEIACAFRPVQIRQLEFLMGQRNKGTLERFRKGTEAREILEALFEGPSLWDYLLSHLTHFGYEVPAHCLDEHRCSPIVPCGALQEMLKGIYSENASLADLFDTLIELDSIFQQWRYRHARMVERVLRAETGTSLHPTAAFLNTTLPTPLFPDLWAIRDQLSD